MSVASMDSLPVLADPHGGKHRQVFPPGERKRTIPRLAGLRQVDASPRGGSNSRKHVASPLAPSLRHDSSREWSKVINVNTLTCTARKIVDIIQRCGGPGKWT